MQKVVVAVIPAYNEEARVGASVEDARRFVDHVVVVDDCSVDGTADVASDAGAHVLRHAVNRGQGASLQTGMRYALDALGADVVVHFDADGQMRGEEIESVVAPVLAGDADIALGSRFLNKQAENIPFVRKWLTVKPAIVLTALISGMNLTDTHNGFRALSRTASRKIVINLDRMAHASEIIDQIKVHKLRFKEVPVTIRYTEESLRKGQSFFSGFVVLIDLAKHRFFH